MTPDNEVQEATARIKDLLPHAMSDYAAIGKDLIIIKNNLGHGRFLPWIKAEFSMSISSADRFMRAARNHKADKFVTMTNLPTTQPRPAGRSVAPKTVADLKKKLRDLTDEKDRLEDYSRNLSRDLMSEKVLATGMFEQNQRLIGSNRVAKFIEIWNAANEAERGEIRTIVNAPPVALRVVK